MRLWCQPPSPPGAQGHPGEAVAAFTEELSALPSPDQGLGDRDGSSRLQSPVSAWGELGTATLPTSRAEGSGEGLRALCWAPGEPLGPEEPLNLQHEGRAFQTSMG